MLTPDAVQSRLFSLREPDYQRFMQNLLPTLNPDSILGVRLPLLRKLAREIGPDYLQVLPHRYLEENHLHSFLIDRICTDFPSALAQTRQFLPYVDNWAVCDSLRPHSLRDNLPELSQEISLWLKSSHPYTVRFALVLLLNWYLEQAFDPQLLPQIAALAWEDYYVNMAEAWYWSMALAKQYKAAIPYFQHRELPLWIHRKAIQKAIESRQIPPDVKAFLKTLR